MITEKQKQSSLNNEITKQRLIRSPSRTHPNTHTPLSPQIGNQSSTLTLLRFFFPKFLHQFPLFLQFQIQLQLQRLDGS